MMGMENIWVKIVKIDNNMGNKISINIKNTIKNTAGKGDNIFMFLEN